MRKLYSRAAFQYYILRIKSRNRLACIVRARSAAFSGNDRANDKGGGWRAVAVVPGSVHLSRVLSSARIRPLFTGDSRFSRTLHRVLTRNVFIMRSASKLRVRRADRHCRWIRCGEAGLPLFAPASIKQIFSDLRRVTKHTARTAVKTPSAAVFHSSARFSCLDRFHSCLVKAGETYLSMKPRTFGSQT